MTKGTQSFGRRNCKTHAMCPRCGKHSYHIQHRLCASCGYPSKKIRTATQKKAQGRRTTGTGRMRYLKTLVRKAKNGFRHGKVAVKSTA